MEGVVHLSKQKCRAITHHTLMLKWVQLNLTIFSNPGTTFDSEHGMIWGNWYLTNMRHVCVNLNELHNGVQNQYKPLILGF